MEKAIIKSDTPFRPGNAEHLSTQRCNKVPKCILELPSSNGARVPLKDEEVSLAKKDLIDINFIMSKYGRERKFRIDSTVVGQSIGVITFKPSKGAKPDKRGCFGVVKVRGNYPNTSEADKRCDVLLAEDENCDIDMPLVGKEFPLMVNNEVYTYSVRDVDTKQIITDTTTSLMKEKEEKDEKEKKAMLEKQKQLLDETNEEEKEKTLTDYALYEQLRTKKANNLYVIEKCKNNLAKCQENIDNALKEILEIDSKFPSYKNDYIKNYIDEIKQVGIDPKQMEIIKYMFSDDLSQEIKEEINPTKISLTSSTEENNEIQKEEIMSSTYTKDRKTRTDPEVLGQTIGLVSFIPSKDAKPDSEGSFGVMKLRGNFQTALEAEKWCEMLIRDYDSYSTNQFVFVGREYPLMASNEIYNSPHKEEDLKDVISKVVKTYLKELLEKREKEEKDMLERQSKLSLNKEQKRINTDKEEDKASIEYYTLLNVKRAYNLHQLNESELTMKKSQVVIQNTEKEIREMEGEFPYFKKEYLDRFIEAVKKAGNPEESDTFIKHMIDEEEMMIVKQAVKESKNVVIEEVEEKKE
uniref:Uncharacterized protein n=1 Tax=viral metagenome TaxID=1070528 RepID=A0A6C0DK18_9ZZZZ